MTIAERDVTVNGGFREPKTLLERGMSCLDFVVEF
jgi:hypothetical protein